MPNLTNARDDLIFRSEGKLYDASTLHRYDTGNPSQPAIYVTPDGTRAFLLTVDSVGIFGILLVGGNAVQRLAARYRIKDLIRQMENSHLETP